MNNELHTLYEEFKTRNGLSDDLVNLDNKHRELFIVCVLVAEVIVDAVIEVVAEPTQAGGDDEPHPVETDITNEFMQEFLEEPDLGPKPNLVRLIAKHVYEEYNQLSNYFSVILFCLAFVALPIKDGVREYWRKNLDYNKNKKELHEDILLHKLALLLKNKNSKLVHVPRHAKDKLSYFEVPCPPLIVENPDPEDNYYVTTKQEFHNHDIKQSTSFFPTFKYFENGKLLFSIHGKIKERTIEIFSRDGTECHKATYYKDDDVDKCKIKNRLITIVQKRGTLRVELKALKNKIKNRFENIKQKLKKTNTVAPGPDSPATSISPSDIDLEHHV